VGVLRGTVRRSADHANARALTHVDVDIPDLPSTTHDAQTTFVLPDLLVPGRLVPALVGDHGKAPEADGPGACVSADSKS